MHTIIAAIHGIMTSQTDPSWPDQLDAWMFERDPEVKVLKKEYRAGPFPRWNCWVKDPLLARSLANELELFLHPTTPESGLPSLVTCHSPPSLWFVAHSNGAVIALLTAARLIERGFKIGGVILTGAACEADINLNGILEWQCRGLLGAAIAYSSADDQVLAGAPAGVLSSRSPVVLWSRLRSWLWGRMIWPYGGLGRTGWLFDGRPLNSGGAALMPLPSSPFTRWYGGGHSAYFAARNITLTFEQFYQDIKAAESRMAPDDGQFMKGVGTARPLVSLTRPESKGDGSFPPRASAFQELASAPDFSRTL